MEKRGTFITFEGIDGCGKSTQIKKFAEYLFNLNKHNHVILTRNPYKETKIRDILKKDSDPLSQAELLAELFIEDRKKHVAEIIIPNIQTGNFVVSDRYKLSTLAYQTAQGLNIHDLIKRHEGMPIPDITFIIDVSAEEAIRRMKLESERAEQKFESNIEFIKKLRENYLKLKDILKDEKIFIINGELDKESIFKSIKDNFEREIMKKNVRYTSMEEVPDKIKDNLSKYFTSIGKKTFVIHSMPPELTGGALARYSRAPTGMQLTIINEFLDDNGQPSQEKGSELMDRVLNAYGDDSVGELEGAHIGIEDMSQLMTKTIEDKRIGGSPIEQSTRYVKYDQKDKEGRWRYLRPKEIMITSLAKEYEEVNDIAFETYSESVKRLIEYFKKKLPEESFQIEVERENKKIKLSKSNINNENEEKAFRIAYNFTIRCAALDVARCVLPSSTLTHMGIFGNGRFFTNLITTLKSSEIEEEVERGKEIEIELNKVIPTFIKRNYKNDEIKNVKERMTFLSDKLLSNIHPKDDFVKLIEREDYLDEVIASSLFPYTKISLQQILDEIKKLDYNNKINILREYIGKRKNRRDRTGRGAEASYPMTFDLVGSFAEYSTDLGFVMPPEMKEIEMEERIIRLVEKMESLNKSIKDIGLITASQYATLFNHRIRWMMGMNLRELQHLVELRSQPAGHFSYRSMVMEMTRKVKERYEWSNLALEFVDFSDPDNKISRANEQSKIAGKNLAKGISSEVDL